MFTYEEAQNLIKIINRVDIKGVEALPVVALLQKLSQVQPEKTEPETK